MVEVKGADVERWRAFRCGMRSGGEGQSLSAVELKVGRNGRKVD